MDLDGTMMQRARDADPPPATVADIARAAGVSTATVDRVLHGRPNVRPLTAQRVLRAAAALKAVPEDAARRALAPPPMEVAFLLPAGTNRYVRMVADAVGFAQDSLRPYNVRCRVHEVDSFDPAALAFALLRHGRAAQGIALMGVEHPLVRDAVRALAARGVHVVTLITDVADSPRVAYVGIDHRSAGRTAALLIGRLSGGRGGEVATIAGSLGYRGHEEREMGFLGAMRESFPELRVIRALEGRDDADSNYRHARALLERHPDLVGLYNIGGAADGVGRALRESGRAGRVVFVAHGLTPDTRALLIDRTLDAVLTQSPQSVVHAAVRILANVRDGCDPMAGVEAVRFSIVMRENLP
jgi:LacI family transcriptional regulator